MSSHGKIRVEKDPKSMNELSWKSDHDTGAASARQGREGGATQTFCHHHHHHHWRWTFSAPGCQGNRARGQSEFTECSGWCGFQYSNASLSSHIRCISNIAGCMWQPPSQVSGDYLLQCPEAIATQMLLFSEIQIFALQQQMFPSSGFSLCLVLIKMNSLLGWVTRLSNSYQAHEMFPFFSLAKFARGTGKAFCS